MMTNPILNFMRRLMLCLAMGGMLVSTSACQQAAQKVEPMFDVSLCGVYQSRLEPRRYDERKVNKNTFQYFSVRGELFGFDNPDTFNIDSFLKDPECPKWSLYVEFSLVSGLCRPLKKFETYSEEEQNALTKLGLGGAYEAKGKRMVGHFTGYVIGVDEKKRVRAVIDCINHIQVTDLKESAAGK